MHRLLSMTSKVGGGEATDRRYKLSNSLVIAVGIMR